MAFVLLILAHDSLDAQSGPPPFYYYQNTPIPLVINPNLVAVRFNASIPASLRQSTADALGDVENFNANLPPPVGGMVLIALRPGRDPLTVAARFNANPNVDFASPVYDFGSVQVAETNEFLARFPQTLTTAEIAHLNADHHVSLARPLPNSNRVLILKPDAGNSVSARQLANLYVETGIAEFAEPNFQLSETRGDPPPPLPTESAQTPPKDRNFRLQWALQNTRQFQGSLEGADIKALPAWDVTRGASSLKVAVIDEGVYATHPDLAGKVLTGYNSLDGSNNTTPKLDDHHGTGVAGVIAANTNNVSGMAGVCWFCQILPVKVAETDSDGDWVTTTAALASGIDWAWQNGADVLNNSWTMNAPSDSVQLAIINARFGGRGGKGSSIVFASGNQGANVVSFPASLNSYVIAVGASNWCDQRKTITDDACNFFDLWGSNYGSALDLLAPGEQIYTTCNGSQCNMGAFTYLSGTSLATPHVAGVAALLYSLNPNLTPDQVQSALQIGAQDIGVPGRDDETGYGRLDAYRAIASMYNLTLNARNKKQLVLPDQIVTYTLKYANTGISAMGGAQLSVTLPANTIYKSSTPPFTPSGSDTYRLDLGTLPAKFTGSAKFRVQVQSSAAGHPIVFSAQIGGAFPEWNENDNTAENTALGVQRLIFLPFLQNRAQ